MVGTRRSQRGAAMLMYALLLIVLAGAGMLRSLEARAVRDMEARARSAGAQFVHWFRAAHHLAQDRDGHFRNLVALHGGTDLSSDSLHSAGLVPPWMPARSDAGHEFRFGIIDDGHGVPMAFAVATPARPLSLRSVESFVAGAAAGRVGELAGPGRESRAARWTEAIERVLGRTLQPGELFTTADVGIARDRRVMYRREQPGRAVRTRMETPLILADGSGVSEVDELRTLGAELSESLSADIVQTSRMSVARSASVSGEAEARHGVGEDVKILASLGTPSLRAGAVGARSLSVETELFSRTARSAGGVTVLGNTLVDGVLDASEARSSTLTSERLEAWNASATLGASASIRARSSVGERAEFAGQITVTGQCAGC